MTSSPQTTSTLPSTEQDATCPVCPHPIEDHDTIGNRFCTATKAGGFNRGCVCGGAQAGPSNASGSKISVSKSSATKEKG